MCIIDVINNANNEYIKVSYQYVYFRIHRWHLQEVKQANSCSRSRHPFRSGCFPASHSLTLRYFMCLKTALVEFLQSPSAAGVSLWSLMRARLVAGRTTVGTWARAGDSLPRRRLSSRFTVRVVDERRNSPNGRVIKSLDRTVGRLLFRDCGCEPSEKV